MIVICGNEKFDISNRPDILEMEFFKALKEENINEVELIMNIPLFKMFIENNIVLELFDNDELENIFIGYLYFGTKGIEKIVKIISERIYDNEHRKTCADRVYNIEEFILTSYIRDTDIIKMFSKYDENIKNNILQNKQSKFEYLDCLIKTYIEKNKFTLEERLKKHREFLNDMCPDI